MDPLTRAAPPATLLTRAAPFTMLKSYCLRIHRFHLHYRPHSLSILLLSIRTYSAMLNTYGAGGRARGKNDGATTIWGPEKRISLLRTQYWI